MFRADSRGTLCGTEYLDLGGMDTNIWTVDQVR